MGVWEIVLIVACVAIVVGVATAVIVRKVKGKPACCDECSGGCPHCSAVKRQSKEK